MLHLAVWLFRFLLPKSPPEPPGVIVSDPLMRACLILGCGKDTSSDDSLSDGYLICWFHQEQLRAKLRTIETYMGLVSPMPKTGGLGVRRAPGFGSRPPADLNAIVMTDPRSAAGGQGLDDDPDPMLSVPAVLGAWTGLLHDVCPNTVEEALTALLVRVDWIARQDWVADFAEEITKLYGQLRSVVRDEPWPTVGPCIRSGCVGTVRRVDAPHADPDLAAEGRTEQRVRCGLCRHDYLSAFEWLEISRKGDLDKDRTAAA
jgi:hypothetical protein